MCVGEVAQRGAVAAREHGSHEVASQRWSRVPDRVDAVVHPAQAPVAQPASHAVSVDAQPPQLLAGDAAVLASRDPRDDVEECSHVEQKATSTCDSPRRCRRPRTRQRRTKPERGRAPGARFAWTTAGTM